MILEKGEGYPTEKEDAENKVLRFRMQWKSKSGLHFVKVILSPTISTSIYSIHPFLHLEACALHVRQKRR